MIIILIIAITMHPQLPDEVRTHGLVEEVPRFYIVNFHGKLWQICWQIVARCAHWKQSIAKCIGDLWPFCEHPVCPEPVRKPARKECFLPQTPAWTYHDSGRSTYYDILWHHRPQEGDPTPVWPKPRFVPTPSGSRRLFVPPNTI